MADEKKTAAQPAPEPPIYGRPIREIINDLRKDIPAKYLSTKTKGGTQLKFVSWFHVVKLLDWYAPGWCYEIRQIHPVGAQTAVVARITIPAAEGLIYREATGIEDDDDIKYGDTTSNAESMALRRAASKFGLALYLYEKK